VDEMRELTSGVNTLPFDSKYKVYILDEVHMLSKSSFNALLKTLEEPPAHVVFILATTELHKVLDTVKSRCQVFEFKKPTIEILQEMLIAGADKEDYKLNPEAAKLIAHRANGAFRDAWGILERVLQSATVKQIDVHSVVTVMATPHQELVISFIESLVTKNLDATLNTIHQIIEGGHSLEHFIENILEYLRLVLLFRFSPKFAEEVSADMPDATIAKIKSWAGEKNIINANLLVEFINTHGELKKTSLQNIPMELLVIKLLSNQE
jgi:DNA polymerase-3 subunit gamma/tau